MSRVVIAVYCANNMLQKKRIKKVELIFIRA